VDCIFCKIDSSKILIEKENCISFYDIYPVSNGHVLVIPKIHISNYFDIELELRNDLWNLVNETKIVLTKKFNPDGFNVGLNINAAAGQTIFHCHIHIIPRYNGDMEDPKGGVRGVIPSKQKY
jgi:diadenosine tetraphosphate (Ap4A) HIT family hydrolase